MRLDNDRSPLENKVTYSSTFKPSNLDLNKERS